MKPAGYLTSFLLLLVFRLPGTAQAEDSRITAVFWNLENFFDFRDSGNGSADKEFSPSGERHWTASRFYRKCNAAGKGILWLGEKYGKMPDIIGLAEIENSFVMKSLLNSDVLKKFNYSFIHYDSADHRGIDVALAYRRSTFSLENSGTAAVENSRDVLYVALKHLRNGRTYHFIVNHHPSKYGGEKQSAGKRILAMKIMLSITDSLACSEKAETVVMGDFNDGPRGKAFGLAAGKLENLGIPLSDKGKGTIKYNGKWELIDNFLVSAALSDKTKMSVAPIPFLMVRDNTYSGEKPLRTYVGPRYAGGVSDHCPIVLEISLSAF